MSVYRHTSAGWKADFGVPSTGEDACVDLSDVARPMGAADIARAHFGGGWLDELATVTIDGVPMTGVASVTYDRALLTTPKGATGTARGSWCARFIGHINGVPVYEDPSLDGNEMGPVVVGLGKPAPSDPATTCSCGAAKAHEQRVCGACFARVEPAAAVPEREEVTRVRCPKCRGKSVLALVRATYDVCGGRRTPARWTSRTSIPLGACRTCRWPGFSATAATTSGPRRSTCTTTG